MRTATTRSRGAVRISRFGDRIDTYTYRHTSRHLRPGHEPDETIKVVPIAMVRCGSHPAQQPMVPARVTRAGVPLLLLLLCGLLSSTSDVLATTASVAASDGPDKEREAATPDFLTVVVPVAEGSNAELRLRNGDRLDIKVRLRACACPLDPRSAAAGRM